MKRKILSLILVFAMTVSLLTVGTGAVEPTYGDTAGHWAESSIERWSGHGIIQGSNGLFDPNGQLTCAQLATILAKLLKLPAAKDAGFTDNTADAWYYDAINRCAAAGILNGNGDGTVTPEAPITRERAMVMLARALGIEPIRKPDLTKYTDAAQVSAYAQGYVAALIEAGIVGGVTADELAPQDNINRASTVTILDRAISTYADKAGATVKADGKGLVLVVAENVKITNAPEGTKIVVADGATGLTVNGKSVSDDQTYIVPKTTTSSGSSSGGYSHTHNWKDNYCAGCGQFKDTVVAVIGKKGYLTLKEAVTAATNGQTVKLVKDVELSKQFTIDKAITLDLGSHTLKSTWTMSGGQMYAIISNAPLTIQNGTVAVGQARAITAHNNLILDSVTLTQELTGGNACVAFSAAGKAYLITNSTIKGAYAVCNFANNATITISGSELIGTGNVLYHNGSNCGLNLTVIDTTITGTGDGCGVYLSGSTETLRAGGLQKATFKNCTITGTNGVETKYTDLTMENCTVTATGTPSFKQNNNGPTTSGFAVVSTDNTMEPSAPAPDGKTTITGNKGSYTGLIGLRTFPNILDKYPNMKESTYAIAGGTFDHNPDAQYIAAGYVATANTNGTWTVSEKTGVTLVAQVGVNKYESLAKALAAAKDGDTVKLVGNTELDADVSISNKITLDLDDKTIETKGNTISIAATGDLTVTGNGIVNNNTEATVETVNGTEVKVRYTMFAVDAGGKLDIESGTFKTKASQIVYTEGTTIIAGGTFENTAGDVNNGLGSSSMLCAKGASAMLTMDGGSIVATAESQDDGIYGIYGANGAKITLNDSVSIHTSLAAIGMNNTTSNPEVVVTINGGEYKTTNANLGTSYPQFNTVVYLPGKCHVIINGGTFTAENENTHIFSVPYVNVGVNLSISNGTFDGKTDVFFTGTRALSGQDEANTISITGGTFSSNPSAYVAEGYIAYQKDDGTYQVVKNAGTVNVSLSELNKIAITKGPKATGEKTSFTVDLGSETVAPSDIAYSENNSGYTGKGVQIGSHSLNNYAAEPAKVGDYEFVIKGGTITSEATGYSSIDSYKDTSVYMLVPGNSNVTFEDVTFEGVLSFDIQKYTSPWSNLNSLTFKNCIFKGIIIGTCPVSNVTFDHCKFMNYTNTSDANNSNPIWWREDTEGSGANANPIKTFTFVNNEVVGTRPLKIERIGKTISPTFTFKNNTFDISKQDGDTGTKNMAINIGMGENPNLPFTLIDEGNTISANTAALYTASLTGGSNWYKEEVPGMKVLDGNGNAKIITAMVWKTTTGETFELKSVD